MNKIDFETLLNSDHGFDSIQIPMIQRDYVYGRVVHKDCSGVERLDDSVGDFLKDIFRHIRDNEVLDMHSLFGAIKGGELVESDAADNMDATDNMEDDDIPDGDATDTSNDSNGDVIVVYVVYASDDGADRIFIPLDGQQRLTTLFLLYWYFAKMEFTGEQLDSKMELLRKFGYETRATSRKFCEDICSKSFNLTADRKPSEIIKNQTWFLQSYHLDQTVASMLEMLDVIHGFYVDGNKAEPKPYRYAKLSLLQFNFLSLGKFGLTEDLYLRMNARRKELTRLEKFKAKFVKHIKENKWEEGLERERTFAWNADRKWSDLFWRYRKNFDDGFLCFIAEIALIANKDAYNNLASKERKACEKRLQEIANNPHCIRPSDFTPESLEFLKSITAIYVAGKQTAELHPTLKVWKNTKAWDEKKSLFDLICHQGSDVTYPKRVMFYAQTVYLQRNKEFNSKAYNKWMRVVRNIAENTAIDSIERFYGAIGLVEELSMGANAIYEFLCDNEIKSRSDIVAEEKFKAKCRCMRPELSELIDNLEDLNFCSGFIRYALACLPDVEVLGIKVAYEKIAIDKIDESQLLKIYNIFKQEFATNEVSNDFRRVLLTCGNNRFYEYWASWSYGLDMTKRCLIEDRNVLRWNMPYFMPYFKEAINKLMLKTAKEILTEYAKPAEMPNWEKRLIKESDLLDKHCSGHYFGIKSNTCYLFHHRKRPSDIKDCFEVK